MLNDDVEQFYYNALKIIFSEEDVSTGMNLFCFDCKYFIPHPVWREISRFGFEKEISEIKNWIIKLLTEEPPEDNINTLWLIISAKNSKLIFETCENFDPTAKFYLHHKFNYYSKNKMFFSHILAEVKKKGTDINEEKYKYIKEIIENILPFIYGGLVMSYLCRNIQPELLLGNAEERYAGFSLSNGEGGPIGIITKIGFYFCNCFDTFKRINLVMIKNFPGRLDADQARQILEKEGIYSIIQSSDMGGIGTDEISFPQGADLYVPKENFQEAKSIIETIFGDV